MRIGDRLRQRRHLVGRTTEQALFDTALQSAPGECSFCALLVHGSGGIGKTTLLEAFADNCSQKEVPCHFLNGRDIEPKPTPFLAALGLALGNGAANEPLEFLASHPERRVLLIDNFDKLESLEGWLRETFLPQLSGETLVVMAGRNPLPPAWRADSAWQSLTRTVSLRNLSPEESRELLQARGIPPEQWEAALRWTHGYPLALSLLCQVWQQQSAPWKDEAPPDVMRALVERFVEQMPTPRHRAALEASALVRVTTEATLAGLLPDATAEEAHSLFNWLAGLSFVEAEPVGLAPHAIARDALLFDLRWRSPERYIDLHRKARDLYAARLREGTEAEQQRTLWDYVFLHRDHPLIRGAFQWTGGSGFYVDVAHPGDEETLAGWVRQHEGEESERIFRHWFRRGSAAQSTQVLRATHPEGGMGEPVGFWMHILVQASTPNDQAHDPAVRAAACFLEQKSPLRPQEVATLFRFWMAGDTYHGISPLQSLILVQAIRHYLTTPRLAYSLFPIADEKQWAPALAYAGMNRIPEADYTVGERTSLVFGHDWRTQPPTHWLASLAEKEVAPVAGGNTSKAASALRPLAQGTEASLLVLSEVEFRAAARQALRDLHAPEALRTNPLLRSALIAEQITGTPTTPSERVTALIHLITTTAKSLAGNGKRNRAYLALRYTYLESATTQERAADLLNLPFSTFRRHLAEGVEFIIDALWEREIGQGAR